MSIRVRNWRDQAPYVGHISALVWTLYQSHDKDETSPPDVNRLHGINSFVKHGLQGHQHSDHHQHDSIEQLYFILRGRGQLTIGDDKVDVRDGTAIYMPVNVPHQAFNDGDGWMEHLIVSCPLDEIREGTPAVRDWRDVHPVVLACGTVSWPLLRREEEAPAGEGGVLQRVHSVTRCAVQGRRETGWQALDGIELVHYVISGLGSVEDSQGNRQLATEGSAVHVLPGEAHKFVNQGEGWFEYVTFAVEVGEIEDPDESGQDEVSDEIPEQAGAAEVAAATLLTEIDWDEADAVEVEEEIEESVTDDDDGEDGEEVDDGEGEVDEVEEEIEETITADVDEEDGEEVDDGDDEVDEVEMEEDDDEDVEDLAHSGDDQEDAVVDDDDGEGETTFQMGLEDTEDDFGADDVEEDEVAEEDDDAKEDDDTDVEEATVEIEYDDAVDDEAEARTGEDEREAQEEVAYDAEAEVEVQEDTGEDQEDAENASIEAEEEGGTDDSSRDEEEDDFDLEDEDTEFEVEDEDETAVEDEPGEENEDSPDADRR